MKIAVIGGGNMGGAIAAGAIASGVAKAECVTISHARGALIEQLAQMGAKANIVTDNVEAVVGADIVFVAVKPWLMEQVLGEIKTTIDPSMQIVASIAAGISFDMLANYLKVDGKPTPPLFRIIPNTAISLGQSVTFISSCGATELQRGDVKELFASLGDVFELEESMITAATALSSCGIAYIFKYIDASIKGGIEMGINSDQARKMVIQTVKGSLAMLEANGSDPQAEIDKVTTPGGITLKGLQEMERCGFTQAVINGLKASR